MDPKATLFDAAAALEVGDELAALTALAEYRRWRNHGGFAPAVDGDLVEKMLYRIAIAPDPCPF